MCKQFCFILLIVFLTSCQDYKNQSQLLVGEWMYIPNSFPQNMGPVGLQFTDSSMYSIHNEGSFEEGNYTLTQDSIQLNWRGENRQSLIILELTSDSLVLKSSGKVKRLYSHKLDYNPELHLENIILVAGTCFGPCPEFVLHYNANGTVRFKSTKEDSLKAETSFTLTDKKIFQIDSLFKFSNIDILDTNEFYGAVDDWDMSMTFTFNGDQRTRINGTYLNMPYRIKPMLYFMVEELKKQELL